MQDAKKLAALKFPSCYARVADTKKIAAMKFQWRFAVFAFIYLHNESRHRHVQLSSGWATIAGEGAGVPLEDLRTQHGEQGWAGPGAGELFCFLFISTNVWPISRLDAGPQGPQPATQLRRGRVRGRWRWRGVGCGLSWGAAGLRPVSNHVNFGRDPRKARQLLRWNCNSLACLRRKRKLMRVGGGSG